VSPVVLARLSIPADFSRYFRRNIIGVFHCVGHDLREEKNMKMIFINISFTIISLVIAISAIVLLPGPGKTGFYLGISLMALTFMNILFSKKKSNDPGRPV